MKFQITRPIKTTVKSHYTPMRMAKVKKYLNS